MELRDLRSVQTDERKTDGLQPLEDSFYSNVAIYLEELRDQRDAAADQAADPFRSEEVQQLTDKIDTAEEVIEAIYERRVGKLVKQASLAAAGFQTDTDNMTTEEIALYEQIIGRLQNHRDSVLTDLTETTTESPSTSSPSGTQPSPTTASSNHITDSGSQPVDEQSPNHPEVTTDAEDSQQSPNADSHQR